MPWASACWSLLVPLVGLGAYLSDSGDETETSCLAVLAAGYRHIDTAQGYDNEASVGAAIARSGVDRADIFVTTKLWPGNAACLGRRGAGVRRRAGGLRRLAEAARAGLCGPLPNPRALLGSSPRGAVARLPRAAAPRALPLRGRLQQQAPPAGD